MFTNSLQWPSLLLPPKTAQMEMSHRFAFRRLLGITAHFSCCLNPRLMLLSVQWLSCDPMELPWGHQGTLGTGSLWHERDEALCSLKRETKLRTTHIPQDLLEIFGLGWRCDYKQGDVAEDGWCQKLEQACALQRGLSWWEQDFRVGSCLSSRWCRVHLQVLGIFMDKDVHMQLTQFKLSLFQLSMLLYLFTLKNNSIKSVYNIWSQCP